jgi:hypothetical protein
MKKPREGRPGRIGLYLGLLLSILFGGGTGQAATLVWDPNPPEEGVVHYTVYVLSLEVPLLTNVTTSTSFPLAALPRGVDLTLRVTATSAAGLESAPSSINYFGAIPPEITVQPLSKSIAAGDPLELVVEASGTPPFYFQWSRNGAVVPTQTNQTLFIAGATTANAGDYSVTVTNAAGSVVSSSATVTVLNRPSIAGQPSPQTVLAGGRLLLSVTANGSSPLSYQWFRNGQAILGAQTAEYEVLSATSANAGNYFVQVTNAVGSAQSATVAVTVQAAPTITEQPQSVTVSEGSQIALAVSADGSSPLSYQWFKGNSELAGRTAATLVIASSVMSDAGAYRVRVTNPYGSIDSDPATVVVQTSSTAPSIVTHPRSVTVGVGSPVELEVLASGTSPLWYQWFKNGTALTDETNSVFSIIAAAVTNTGSYTVAVSNVVGSVTSSPGIISVLTAPAIITQPGPTNLVAGGSLVLAVEASGSLPLTYEWYHDAQLIAGAAGSTLTIPVAGTDHAGGYRVVVSNPAGAVTSSEAAVVVTQASGIAPVILAHPQGITLNEGDPGSVLVEADGQAPLQFVWFKDGQPLPARTNAILSFSSITKADAGVYTVRVSNRFGSATSDGATITVLTLPRILWQPESVAVRTGNSFQLAVGAASPEPLIYQWIKDGVEIPGATESSYKVISAQAEHTGVYRVKISNTSGFILSQEVTVSIAVAPQITRQPPTETTVNEGAALELSFLASGTGPFVVEWLRNNTVVLVTNVTELVIPDVKPSDAGSYVARVNGPGGSAATLPVAVRVETKPIITTQPRSANVQFGTSVTLTVSATGNGTLSYQWLKDGQPVSGAQNIFLTVIVRDESALGRYSVRVSNAVGFTESEPALIQILAPPTIVMQPAGVDVLVGSPFTLDLELRGTTPYAFQWFKDGIAVEGGETASLSVAAATANHAGTYHVVVTNSVGSVQSANAVVRVIPHIVINQHPTNQSIVAGTSLTLTVEASSELPLSYQWFRDDVELEGQAGAVLQIPRVTNADGGSYHVVVMNSLEELISDIAEVTIVPDPDLARGRLSITTSAAGASLVGQGEPGATYNIQRSTDLSSQDWTTIQTVIADEAGRFEFQAPSGGQYWFIRTFRE